ncbi:MAG: hypothetical protein M3Z10_01525 [Gemmatimonadota bacterium]|nr:hypothetical protein [Gemmatimonadota bacterium]
MAVREFTDDWGTEWRVWDVTPEVMHPITRSEDYMKKLQDGWLAFESTTEKRRLPAPYPGDWTEYDLKHLEQLCQRATPVFRKPQTPNGEQRAAVAGEIEREAFVKAGEVRTFSSPRGREWTVRVHECLDRAGRPSRVLRFTSGDVVAELTDWPPEWREATMRDFAVMLLDAEPRRRSTVAGQQRRREDRAD